MPEEEGLVPFKAKRGGIPLPEQNAWIGEDDDDLGPPEAPVEAEVVTKAEHRRYEESKVRVPDEPLDVPPIARRSLVTPIEVKAKTLWGFLAAMSRFVEPNKDLPIIGGVKLTFLGGRDPKLMLEATNHKIWVGVGIDVISGVEDFQCVLPLGRAMNVIKLLAWKHSTVFIGIDEHRIYIGNYSFPFKGMVEHFPKRKSLRPEEWRIAIPVSLLREMEEKLLCVTGGGSESSMVSHDSLEIDFNNKVAFATDGVSLHLMQVPSIYVEQTVFDDATPMEGVAIPRAAIPFLIEVAERDLVGLKIHPERIMFGAEDCALVAEPIDKYIEGWKKVVPIYEGAWLVDSAKLIEVVEESAGLNSEHVSLFGDHDRESLEVTSRSADGDEFGAYLPIRTSGRVLGSFSLGVNPEFLLRAVKACLGGVVRIGVNGGMNDPITIEDEQKTFKAVVMKRGSNE